MISVIKNADLLVIVWSDCVKHHLFNMLKMKKAAQRMNGLETYDD